MGIFDEEIFHIVLFGTLTPASCQTPTKLFSLRPRQQDGVRNDHHRQNRNDFGENECILLPSKPWLDREKPRQKLRHKPQTLTLPRLSFMPSLLTPPCLGLCQRPPAPPCRSLPCSPAGLPGCRGISGPGAPPAFLLPCPAPADICGPSGLHCALWGLEPAGPSCVRHGAALAPPCTGPAAGSVLQGTQYHLLRVNR